MASNTPESKGKILLVDDDPGLLRLLSIRLRAEDYEVEAVESAHKALAVLHRFRPDLVITDLKMDKMDGIGLLKELQTKSPGLRVVIIFSNRTVFEKTILRYYQAGLRIGFHINFTGSQKLVKLRSVVVLNLKKVKYLFSNRMRLPLQKHEGYADQYSAYW